jgi:hypothetical protein
VVFGANLLWCSSCSADPGKRLAVAWCGRLTAQVVSTADDSRKVRRKMGDWLPTQVLNLVEKPSAKNITAKKSAKCTVGINTEKEPIILYSGCQTKTDTVITV